MPRHLIGDAHEWINEIPTVPTHSLAKLQPSQRSWDYLCIFMSQEIFIYTVLCIYIFLFFRHILYVKIKVYILLYIFSIFIICVRATAGQEDPFELDSNLLLSSGRHGKDRKRQSF